MTDAVYLECRMLMHYFFASLPPQHLRHRFSNAATASEEVMQELKEQGPYSLLQDKAAAYLWVGLPEGSAG